MTNYEKLFRDQMKSSEFANAYYEARIGRIVCEKLSMLKEKIYHNEPKEKLIQIIDSIHQNIYLHNSQDTHTTYNSMQIA
ncbi:hypothetical protein MHK_003985 [Candidatus Magnetomorum sp. HK-1]|nr:hypothetical protein MHK_003985 [Candidatus Magnetomorum sp. HK-1]